MNSSSNTDMKQVLTGTNEILVGDKIVGYGGKNTKQIFTLETIL